ncbi:hypothetical protein ABT369_27710 [Dactylosporangium sp. NPDC000244]|uniref:TolB family protein n=1 Tax=Dactylosporangium sp. NPDC000244 TaxID=3154365 RepID=UPI0033199A15
MSNRAKLIALGVVIAVALLSSVGYVVFARRAQTKAAQDAPPVATIEDLTAVQSGPRIVFRSTALGERYGKVAEVPLTAPAGPRAFTPVSCDRVYAREGQAVCLAAKPGVVTTYTARVLGADWSPVLDLPLSGVPSRTRLSRDGSMVATTTFVSGHDYSSPGQFSTETLVTNIAGRKTTNIEQFTLTVDGKAIDAKDRNMWGVTFADDDHFYATAASGKKTWLVRGTMSTGRLEALREDAECPSLSPDGKRIAFKERAGRPAGEWGVTVYDIATGKATRLAEPRSVDDQIEWLDDSQVVYGLPRAGEGPAASDVWVVPADGSGASRVLIPDAWSPAVVR